MRWRKMAAGKMANQASKWHGNGVAGGGVMAAGGSDGGERLGEDDGGRRAVGGGDGGEQKQLKAAAKSSASSWRAGIRKTWRRHRKRHQWRRMKEQARRNQ